jgi:hypothetical protein
VFITGSIFCAKNLAFLPALHFSCLSLAKCGVLPHSKKQRNHFMQYPMVRCYHPNASIPPHSFFILCKGNNAGRPALVPWQNSFIATCSNEEYFKFFFWLVYGLHQSKKFKVYQRGSVIPYINVNDVRLCIREVALLIHPDWARFQEILSSLERCNKLKASLAQQIIATEKLQQVLLQQYFQQIKNAP